MISIIIYTIAFAFTSPHMSSAEFAGIVTGHPKWHKRHIYRAKGYDPYIYSGSFPFAGVV